MSTEISLRIDDRLYARLSSLAESLDLSAEEAVAEAIIEKLQRHRAEDQARLREHRADLERFRRDRLGLPYEEASRYLQSIFDEKPLQLPECRKL